jgi:glycosyltransferase involved in cell wall biosynthesis
MADRVHCVSHDARANLLEHIVVLRPVARKVLAIPNGIEVERFQRDEQRDLRRELGLPADSFLIGFLGRFMSQKGFRYLVSAFERVRAANCSGRTPLVLTFGEQDGFIREEMEDVRRRGLAQSILFQPFVDDVSSTLKGLDVLAMPSLWEACGLLAMEAMVAGVPVIGSDCVGLREVLRDTPATIVPPRDSIALAEALLNEMTRPSTQRARRFARAAAIRFDVRARAADLENVFMQLLVGK